MTKKYLKNYQVLGIPPDARWEDLRNAYKSLVKNWHPDRFQQNADQKKIAEERTKEINKSYKELAEYYKKHGALPVHEEPENPREKEPSHPGNPPPTQQREVHAWGQASTPQAETTSTAKSPQLSRRMVIAILVGAGFAVWYLMFGEQHEKLSRQSLAVESHTPETDTEGSAPVAGESSFTYGSSIGEVIAIQGVPTRTESDYFANR